MMFADPSVGDNDTRKFCTSLLIGCVLYRSDKVYPYDSSHVIENRIADNQGNSWTTALCCLWSDSVRISQERTVEVKNLGSPLTTTKTSKFSLKNCFEIACHVKKTFVAVKQVSVRMEHHSISLQLKL